MDIMYLGWCREGTSDKVWGIVKKDINLYATFWGRRGAKLQKNVKDMSGQEAMALIRSKQRKGYLEIPKDDMERVHDSLRKYVFKIGLSI